MRHLPFIGANWKMHPVPDGALDALSPYRLQPDVEIVVFPAALYLGSCIAAGLVCGGQAGRAEGSGAFTGEISMRMLAEVGCRYVLCGHSERRQHHGDTDDDVRRQAEAAREAGLIPLVCVGETNNERAAGMAQQIVARQLQAVPKRAEAIVAYEPVWAIGTGSCAEAAEVQRMHAFIRSTVGPAVRIIYGGSVNGEGSQELFSQPDVAGVLVGGASLQPAAFARLAEAARRVGGDSKSR